MVGDIQFDMLGGLGAIGSSLYTTDGGPNWVSDLLNQKTASLALSSETASDHTSFQLAGIGRPPLIFTYPIYRNLFAKLKFFLPYCVSGENVVK